MNIPSLNEGNESLQQFRLFNQMASEEKGDGARMTFFVGAIAMGDLVKSTLGPKGMHKILVSSGQQGEVSVTNDGATILKSINTSNPAAKVLIDIAKTQDTEVGDGTTSVTIFCAELLREAERLCTQKIHPQTIIAGWRIATQVAHEALEASAKDNSKDPERFKRDLMNIARTTLSSKVLGGTYKEMFAEMAVQAVMRLNGSTDLEMIHVIKKPGESLAKSFLDEGFILEKKIGVGQPKRIEKAKILIANTPMDTDKIKIFGSSLKVDSTEQLAKIENAERDRMLEKCKKIRDHNINCFINRQLIYNLPEQYFADHGIMAIEHADFEGVERLALVTGGEIVSTFDSPSEAKLGYCDSIEEIMIGEDKVIRFSGVKKSEACTIVLRGGTKQILDEAERSLHDALCVLAHTAANDHRVVLGAGCSEMVMANAVEELAKKTPGKKAMAIESFATALRMIPTIIADNAGYDSGELVSKLRAAHYNGDTTAGLSMSNGGEIADVEKLGVLESFKLKSQVLKSAAEAAEMILRVDELVTAPPRPRKKDPRLG
ncbi:T-complex protein 1 subunit beta-like [Schistocerca gregaria]|uniref:T-complex protein 1 subunit beta-like n=1 Tax=Schistocerca gregaria TaxID=7010 RepID=UPI00211DB0D0|nr:T-complex protein 1 subunit beta-like [Schistocerca gregaria]